MGVGSEGGDASNAGAGHDSGAGGSTLVNGNVGGIGAGGSGIGTGIGSIAGTTADMPSPAQASRMLAQASFGATTADIDRLTASGYTAWIEEQFAKPQALHRAYIDSITATLAVRATQYHVQESFWQQAVTGED